MKTMRPFFLVLLSLFLLASPAWPKDGADQKWDALMEVTYKFSWYPRQDFKTLVESKGKEYGSTLEAYRDRLLASVTVGGSGDLLSSTAFVPGLPWKDYYRLSLAEFCLFLATDKEVHLANARTVMAQLAARREQTEIAFWNEFYRAYDDFVRNDRDAFVVSIHRVWQDVILRLELNDILMASEMSKAGFVRGLPYLYENLAHLILRKALLEKEMPDLYPLAPVVLALNDHLSLENGYKGMVSQVCERMQGLSSDNYNLSYAVALLEATSKRYEFEGEQTEALLPPKFNATRKYYHLALSWADTNKGRATVLTQYMGFLNYITRRFSYRDTLFNSPEYFDNLPAQANDFIDRSIILYDRLASAQVREGGYLQEGFASRSDYLKSMHYLWDSTAKLAIAISDYFKADRNLDKISNIFPAERPLLRYLELFERHAPGNYDNVPDNAYFLAAFAARELAVLYRDLGSFSTGYQVSNRTFRYQLQAVELFPLDLSGILQLAYQASLDSNVEGYFRYTHPVSARLKESKVFSRWLATNDTPFNPLIGLGNGVVPATLENAFALVNFQEVPEGSEDGLFRKTAVMTRLLQTTTHRLPEARIESLLRAVGRENFTAGVSATRLQSLLAPELAGEQLPELAAAYPFSQLKNELYGAIEHPVHTLLRELYYEQPASSLQYVQLGTPRP